MDQNLRRGLLWATGSAFGIALFTVPWKIAAAHGPPEQNTLLLLTSAAAFSTGLTLFQRGTFPRPTRFDWQVALALALVTLVGNLASAEAISRISPALLTVTQRGEVIVVALLAWPIIGERIEGRFWVAVAIAGAGLLILYDPFTASADSALRADGLLYALVSTLCFASMAVLTRKVIHRIDPVAVNGLRLWVSVALWFALNGAPASLGEINRSQVLYVSLAAFAGPFAGRLCLMTAAKYLEARVTTLATLAAPPLTLVLAFVVIGDLPTGRELFGGGLILLGVAVPVLGLARANRPRSS